MSIWLPIGALLLLLTGAVAQETLPPAPKTLAKSVAIIDALTGDTLYEKNPTEERPVASTQKMLTAILISERGDLDEIITVAKTDTNTVPSIIGIKTGEQYSRRQLLKALIVKSGNDAARALARDYAGSQVKFAKAMNERAVALGMEQSNFVNASGLTVAKQHSSARDIARLAYAAYRIPIIRETAELHELTFVKPDGSSVIFESTNDLLKLSPYCTGFKTGYTNASGRCLVSTGTHGDRSVIVVVLGSTWTGVWPDSHKLLHWSLGLPHPPPPAPKKKAPRKKKRTG
ncbi:MAG: D-alanyl-D-alanine carboxypeptidase family protein [Verrucomicrobiota bacterium]